MALEAIVGFVGVSAILAYLSSNAKASVLKLFFFFATMQFVWLTTMEMSQITGITLGSAVVIAGTLMLQIVWFIFGLMLVIYVWDMIADLLGVKKKPGKTMEERFNKWV